MSQLKLPLLQNKLQYKRSRRAIVLSNYNPFQFPADLDMARNHGLAKRVCQAMPYDPDSNVCPCCLLPIDNELLPLGCSLKKIVHLGVAYPLYFQTIKLCMILLTIHLLVSGFPEFVLNLAGDHCSQAKNFSSICTLSIMNVLDVTTLQEIKIQNALNLSFALLAIIIIEAMKFKMLMTRLRFLQFEQQSSDYSILLKGLPKDITLYEIQQFMQNELNNLGLDPTVVKIYLIYDGKRYLQLYEKQREVYDHKLALEEKHRKMMLNAGTVHIDKRVAYMKKCQDILQEIGEDQNTVEHIDAEISQYEAAFQIMVRDLLQGNAGADVIAPQKEVRFSGKCIVTLNRRESARKLAKHYKLTPYEKLVYRVQQLLKLDSQYRKIYKGNIIKVTMAPEPSDIIYANMGSEKYVKLTSRLIGFFLIASILLLVFVILTFGKKIFSELKLDSRNPMVYSFLVSIIVGLFNSLLGRIIRYFADDEFYTKQSTYYYTVASRLITANLINMILTTLFANLISFYLFNSKASETYPNVPLNFTGLVNDFFFLSATNPLLSCLFTLLDYRYAYRLYKRWSIVNRQPVTQAEANLHFENQPVDMAQRYTHVLRCVLFTSIVCTVVPNSLLISAIVLGLVYLNDKYLLLRRYTCQYKLGSELSRKMFSILDIYPFLLALSNTLLMYVPIKADKDGVVFNETGQSKAYFYVSVGLTILIFFIYLSPTTLILRFFKRLLSDSLTNNYSALFQVSYRERQHQFREDYSHHYPCFRVSTTRKRSVSSDPEEPSSPRKALLLEETNKRLAKGVLDMIREYINNRKYNIRQ